MSGDRIAGALARIETASSRIDAAVRLSVEKNSEIYSRYNILRDETRLALAELDQLITQVSP